MEEPTIIAQHREQLAYLLTEAAEIEHGLMCCYLFAAYSLKREGDPDVTAEEAKAIARWRGVITGVAVEEMLHLALASNLLTSIGFAPQLARPNFPVPPGYHPSGVVVALAPFDASTIDHFVYLERPEGVDVPDGAGFERPPPYERAARADRLTPSSEDYATVGHLYRGIRDGFTSLAARLGERALFVGDPRAQVGPSIAALPGLVAVTDLASAIRAIDTIVEQGEGTASDSERAHYRRFVSVRDEHRALVKARPSFVAAHPVARNPVMRRPPTPQGKVWIEEPSAARLLDLGNALYGHTLRLLGRTFAQNEDSPDARRVLMDAAIESMTIVTPIAERLARMPAGAAHPGVNAGLTFAMARSTLGSLQAASWAVLEERTRELAAGLAEVAGAIDAALGASATELLGVATRIAAARPGAAAAVSPLAVSIPVAAASAPAIEEARGKRLLLRFEGKRCIHSRQCVLGAPDVFRANVQGPWLDPDAMPVERLAAVAHECPSGAITYERLDGGAEERAPIVNVLRVRENGPLAVHAAIALGGRGAMFRATLCRCGASKNKPFCDGSHATVGFQATGEPATQESSALAHRDGVLAITPTRNGPLAVEGNLEICSGTGRTVTRVERARLCRCGGSANKPFCDGTHARNGFQAP
jgi:CDGSH-type Zn-finger protein/uncharacterized Fe-S cluster protein YjdI